MEAGQILHNNPVGAPLPDYVRAMISHLRSELARAYWNTQQKFWEEGPGFDWEDKDKEHGLTPLPPGIEWRRYYNWAGSPNDEDWDQGQASAPNFAFEGVKIRWYKHFGRSMNANVVWEPVKWVRWFERCVQTIEAWEHENCPVLSNRDGFSYPDPSGVVPLEPSADDLRYVDLMQQLERVKAQLNCIACVCLDVAEGEAPRFEPQDWCWCKELDWVTRMGLHALKAPGKLELHDEDE